MRSSRVTWKVSFIRLPGPQELYGVERLLEPVERVEYALDHGIIFREMGLSDHLFIEPPESLTAGELMLKILTKAHRLGIGWSIMWPGFPKATPTGWAADVWERAALPEAYDGLQGGFADMGGIRRSLVPEVHAASFTVEII